MQVIRSSDFTADRAWGALNIASMKGISTRLHWTNQAYQWHINEGEEVFVVLDGQVEMQTRQGGEIASALLGAGDIFYATEGLEHRAIPKGEARILVIEQEGSV